MATIELTQQHSLSHDEIHQRIEFFVQEFQKQYGIEYRWESEHLVSFAATAGLIKGASGKLTLKDKSVRAEVDLPLMFRPLKNLIEKQMQAQLQDKLQP